MTKIAAIMLVIAMLICGCSVGQAHAPMLKPVWILWEICLKDEMYLTVDFIKYGIFPIDCLAKLCYNPRRR